jgi:hypothetical protein
MNTLFNKRQPDAIAVESPHLAQTLKACAVQYRDALATADADDVLCMVGLAASQCNARFPALLGWQKEAVHRNWNKAALG